MMRLNKFLAMCGIASRRTSEDLIYQRRITVNGKVITSQGVQIDPEKDIVLVDGKKIEKQDNIYLVLNKPRGYVTTLHDPQNRPTVLDLLPDSMGRVFPVGRLDYDTEGLLILTNDGELAHRLLHPSFRVYKTYRVKVYGAFSPVKIQKLRYGVRLSDGMTAECEVRLIKTKGKETILEMKIHEGRKRQIRRMCNKVGYKVIELVRTEFAFITLSSLKKGTYRHLGPNELKRLKSLVGLEEESL